MESEINIKESTEELMNKTTGKIIQIVGVEAMK